MNRIQSQQAVGALALAAALVLLWVPDVRAQDVRVLLATPSGRAEIELPGGGRTRIRASRSGGLIVGREALRPGASWESPRSGPHGFAEWRFEGRVRVLPRESGLAVIALVPLERYVAGAVGREMPTSWDARALRSQAVVSRTYALRAIHHPADPDYDVEAGTVSQVFGGSEAAVPTVRAAVAATRGQYLALAGEPILAVFHSASGGRTASAEEVWGDPVPYLRSLEVHEEEEAPSTYWRAAVARTTLRRALARLGLDVGGDPKLSVIERWPSGRVKRLELRGRSGSRTLSGELLRRALGQDVVKSTLFELRERGSDIVIVGSGHGHGVGMSQWGAKAMAEGGAEHAEILAIFYPGTTLERVRPGRSMAAAAAASGGE